MFVALFSVSHYKRSRKGRAGHTDRYYSLVTHRKSLIHVEVSGGFVPGAFDGSLGRVELVLLLGPLNQSRPEEMRAKPKPSMVHTNEILSVFRRDTRNSELATHLGKTGWFREKAASSATLKQQLADRSSLTV